ncbi:hypothetical protein EES39_08400 [Streptomyces sp. ADI92-24]|uniref:DUF4232 domain-containing protein n=1 Tax=Streptomyces sp. ADI92-24 TaxID=1522756 RepID=UPI000F5567E5|nr:DUF4232 domain-containing protein [Streptomyces sp. ADI92-24]RPK49094.1 hypothetical protein EES39_08400 [Streptomyces sp. ADI92-24]
MRSNRIRTTALAATALLAALSLTACSGDNGSTNDNGKAAASAPAGDSAGKQSQPPAAVPEKDATDADAQTDGTSKNAAPPVTKSGKGADTGSTSQVSKNSSGKTTSSKPVTCTGTNAKTTVTKVSRPINHLLLTVTNAGSRPCYAYYAPMLRFDDAQAVFPILKDSQPQAVVTLDPGQSAYAAIGLTGEPGSGPAPRKATHLKVYFADRNSGSTGAPAELPLPANTYWDDNGFVTYWQTEMADALQY